MYKTGSLEWTNSGTIVLAEAVDIIVGRVEPVTHQRASGEHFHKPDFETAKLFAAAPDMLAALERCVEPAEDSDDCPLPADIYNIVCAAIAKAKGE